MSDNGRPAKEYICPLCDKACKSAGGLTAHVKSCERMPSRDVLARECEQGASVKQLMTWHGSSERVIKHWLEFYDLETWGMSAKTRAEDRLKIYPGYAPKRGRKWSQCVDKYNRPVCNALEECQIEVMAGRCCLCEAPDQEQREALERDGYDLLQERTELWVRKPEIWTE